MIWLHQHRIPLAAIDETVLRRFATHECICPGTFVHKAERNRDYQFRIERFVRFLITNGVLSSVASKNAAGADDLRDFRGWLRRHRGIGESTILDHVRAVTRLRQQLGNDPAGYDAALINRVMLEKLKSVSRVGAQQMCGSLRMYLRFPLCGERGSRFSGAFAKRPEPRRGQAAENRGNRSSLRRKEREVHWNIMERGEARPRQAGVCISGRQAGHSERSAS
ncbi:hypothetical protein NKH89_13410 [Mesorhizobium sp. M0923]|uniref:hypothetical protein n=1 Tax=unclassified Mesorhizobium TaxID=325217 RepID=UPI0003D01C90|nr:hypothetical protein [Mesorhizobium sp. L48C026A00]ESZ10991.1 hypothetical protein X737_30160 [Mesorhizobium sp. L48C026A00]